MFFVALVYTQFIISPIHALAITTHRLSRSLCLSGAKGFSQRELAKLIYTSYSVIGKYERDEMQPSIDAAKKIAHLLYTSVGFLLDETDDINVLKDKTMLKRLNEINNLLDEDRHCIMYTIDGLLQNVRTKLAFAK